MAITIENYLGRVVKQKVVVTGTSLDLTAANTTAQPVKLTDVPKNCRISSIEVQNTGSTIAGTSVTAFNVTAGIASGGTTLFTATDLKTAGDTMGSIARQAVKASTPTPIWLGFAPAGGNWAALTSTAEDINFTVYIEYSDNDFNETR